MPPSTRLLGTKYHLTWKPMVYQYAGEEIKDSLVTEMLVNWENPNTRDIAIPDFLSKLLPPQQVWIVPGHKVSDYSSQPNWVDHILPRELMAQPALLHDDMRPKITTPTDGKHAHPTADGFFRDAILVSARQNKSKRITPRRAYWGYLGVRYGVRRGMKFAPPEHLIPEATRLLCNKYGIQPYQAKYNKDFCEFTIQ